MTYENTSVILRSLRKQSGMTQSQMAQKLKIHMQYVSNFERSKCLPPAHVMKKIYKAMNAEQKQNFVQALAQDFVNNYMSKIE